MTQDVMTMKLDYGKVEKITIEPRGNGWGWEIQFKDRKLATGFHPTLDGAIDRVKQMTENYWKEAG